MRSKSSLSLKDKHKYEVYREISKVENKTKQCLKNVKSNRGITELQYEVSLDKLGKVVSKNIKSNWRPLFDEEKNCFLRPISRMSFPKHPLGEKTDFVFPVKVL